MKLHTYLLPVMLLLGTVTAQAQLKATAYADGTQKLNGQAGKPTGAAKGGVLILPAWMGIGEHEKNVAQKLNAEGYHTFIADIYGEGNYPQNTKEAGERAGYFKTRVDEYRRRIQLALDQLVKSGANPDKIVVIGYCFGGFGAIEAARANLNVRGIVSFHGSYGRDASQPIQPIKPKILILHGADDPYSTAADIANLQDEFRKAGADWQMNYYANAVHAFTEPAAGSDNSKGAAYNESADKRSWLALLQFLKEVLQ